VPEAESIRKYAENTRKIRGKYAGNTRKIRGKYAETRGNTLKMHGNTRKYAAICENTREMLKGWIGERAGKLKYCAKTRGEAGCWKLEAGSWMLKLDAEAGEGVLEDGVQKSAVQLKFAFQLKYRNLLTCSHIHKQFP